MANSLKRRTRRTKKRQCGGYTYEKKQSITRTSTTSSDTHDEYSMRQRSRQKNKNKSRNKSRK